MLNYDILILDWQPVLAGFGLLVFISEGERNRLRVESESKFLFQWLLLLVKGGWTVFSFPHCSGLPHQMINKERYHAHIMFSWGLKIPVGCFLVFTICIYLFFSLHQVVILHWSSCFELRIFTRFLPKIQNYHTVCDDCNDPLLFLYPSFLYSLFSSIQVK